MQGKPFGFLAASLFAALACTTMPVTNVLEASGLPRPGDLFCWPPGHTVKAGKDAEVVLFSPQAEHCPVVDHLRHQLGA